MFRKPRLSVILCVFTVLLAGYSIDSAAFAQGAVPIGEIVFASNRDGNTDIYRIDSAGNSLQRLTDHPSVDTNPVWSPDNQWIAFQSWRGGDSAIYVMDANGRNERQITNLVGDEIEPTWTADGQSITFAAIRNDSPIVELFTIRLDNEAITTLTDLNAIIRSPSWSPDGEWLVFASNVHGTTADQFHVYRMRSNGFFLEQLTMTESGSDTQPDWSPDGKAIVFISTRDGNPELYKMPADGSEQIRLTNTGATESNPVFAASGAHIGYVSDKEGVPQLFRMKADGTEIIRLTVSNDDDFVMDCSWLP